MKNNFSFYRMKQKNRNRKCLPEKLLPNNVLLTTTKRTINKRDCHKSHKNTAQLRCLHVRSNRRKRAHRKRARCRSTPQSTQRNILRHEERIIMKDGVLMRKYYGEDGTVTHHQIIIPKQIVPELLSTLHGKTNKHPGITKMIQECRAKFYYPGLSRKIRAWVTSCPDCIANKRHRYIPKC